MSATIAASPPDAFASTYEEFKNGYLKNTSIIRSVSANVSLSASFLLIWIMNRSRSRFTTTYHRLILGMSTFDILFSMSQATFGLISPADVSYMVWNARGNLATCSAFGFMYSWGTCTSIMYSASLNLYYLAKIKYNTPDSFIKRKLEPFLHAVPILFGLVISTTIVSQEGMNSFESSGICAPSPYNPPHCDGLEDGQIPDGFEIPCGRGNSFFQGRGQSVVPIYVVMTTLVVPITIGGSLFMIYRSISKQERRMRRYSQGDLGGDGVGPTSGATSVASVRSSMRSIRSSFGSRRGSRLRNQDSSSSRAVSSRAAAYSISYSVTFVWTIVYGFISIAGAWPTEFPPPTWVITYKYFWMFFLPLQGVWTFLIFMHPKVVHAKKTSDPDISWISAFLDALWLATTGRRRSPCLRRTKRRNDVTPPGSDETQGNPGGAAISEEGGASMHGDS